jgi:hypothetical protein
MAEIETPYCPECDEAFDFPEPPAVGRRDFIRAVGGAAAAVALTGAAARAAAPAKKPRPAEELVRELFAGLSDEQKKRVVLPFDHVAEPRTARPTRKGMYNAAINKVFIQDAYTRPQQELVERIVKALSSGDDGYRQISRNGTWDATRSFGRCGALIFGDPTPGEQFAFVFTGHHMTIRCDGDTEEGPAFGGPIYYGHSPNGYSRGNVFSYQTRSVIKLYKALDEKQRVRATVKSGNPGEQAPSVRFKAKAEDRPGVPYEDLTKDQRALVEEVMRNVLKPYRKEDVEEVMTIIKRNGGMEKIKLAFYADGYEGAKTTEDEPWSFWRLEGPGFVWNYRVLPHVHTYVNISSKLT